MDFKNWLTQTKTNVPRLNTFITRLDPFFNDTGFNGTGFEKSVNSGIRKIETDIDELRKPEPNVED